MPRRGVATGTAIALLATLTACLGAGSAPATTAARTPHVLGFSDEAEVVMGTLTAPPTRAFLARIRSGKMGGVLFLGNDWLTRSKVKHDHRRSSSRPHARAASRS